MKCKDCNKEMEETESSLMSEFDGVRKMFECECGRKCQADYLLEEIKPVIHWDKD